MTTQPSQQSHTDNSDEIDLGKLLGILLDAKWLIMVTTFAFAVFGIAFALLSTPIYKADALIQIEEKSSGGISSMVGDMGDMFSQESSATTEVEIIKSRMILGETVDKFNLTTVTSPSYAPIVGKGFARLTGDINHIVVSRFTLPSYASSYGHTIQIVDAEKGTYQLVRDDERVILKGKVGELATADDYSLFVAGFESHNGFEFSIGKRSRLEAIEWLKASLSLSEQGKQTGILKLSFEGENKQQISEILNHISQIYFLQNVKRNSAEAEKSLEFLESHLPGIKSELTGYEDVLKQLPPRKRIDRLGLRSTINLEGNGRA